MKQIISCPPRWIERVNLKVRATCANPPELTGRRVKDVHVFKSCPGGESLPDPPTGTPKLAKAPKATKRKPVQPANSLQRVKMLKAKPQQHRHHNAKQGAANKSTKKRSMG